MELKTPLYECHEALNGKIVPFAGYLLPVQYSGVIEEHMAVREKAGLFDVSHMGEVVIKGKDALANINKLFTNDFTNMTDGRVRYSPMCNDEGGVIDDLLIYRKDQDEYLIVVNASNRHKDVDWMKGHIFGEVELTDISDEVGQVALQGPNAQAILEKVMDPAQIPAKYYTFTDNAVVAGCTCLVSQTGYTGEHGYEIYCDAADTPKIWNAILEAGKDNGLIPAGLGARDTLRLEAAMPLYGHEMNDEVTPLETGLGFAVKMQKDDFIGKAALEKKGEPTVTRVGLKMVGRGIAREDCPVYFEGKQIGKTTSGTHLPFLGAAYAMAMVDKAHSEVGTPVEVEIRGKKVAAEIIALPFYKKG